MKPTRAVSQPNKAHEKTTNNPPEKGTPAPSEPEPLDRIKEILSKGTSRSLEERFSRIEQRMVAETATLRNELQKRLDSLDSYVRGELSTLTRRMDEDHRAWSERCDEVQTQERAQTDRLKSTVRDLSEKVEATSGELRSTLLDHQRALGEEVRRVQESESQARDEAMLELRAGKTDRSMLATLLAEMAVRLSENELDGPSEHA